MKKNSFFKQNALLFLLLVNSIAAKACWGPIPAEQQLSDAHLVITGKVSSTSYFYNSKRFVYIKVDKVLKNDLDGYPVKSGDKVKLFLPPLRKMSTDFKFKTGTAGLWMLKYSNGNFRAPFPMVVSSMSAEKAEEILNNLKHKYAKALKTTIPEQEKYLKRILSHPAYSVKEAMQKLNKTLPKNINWTKIYMVNRFPRPKYSAVINVDSGELISVMPYYSLGCSDKGICVAVKNKIRFLDRNLRFIPQKDNSPEKNLPNKTYRVSPATDGKWIFAHQTSPYGGSCIAPSFYIAVNAFYQGGTFIDNTVPNKFSHIKGKVVATTMRLKKIRNTLTIVKSSESDYQLVNENGKTVRRFRLPAGYVVNTYGTDVFSFSEGMCPVRKGNKFGFINLQGKIVINPQFERISCFYEGRALCCINRNNKYYWGFIDKSGKWVVKPQFTNVSEQQYSSEAGYSAVAGILGWGVRILQAGNNKVKLSPTAAKYALMQRRGLINNRGDWIIPPFFFYVGRSKKGLIPICLRGAFNAILNHRGEVIFCSRNKVELK